MTEYTPETAPAPTPEQLEVERLALRRQRWIVAGIVAAIVVILSLVGVAIFALLQNATVTANIRDIFIIFMALESLLIGVALIVLIIQLASLTNLVQNELRPILQSTNETINTLRGTSEFLSENLVEPVIKLNSSVAGLRKIFEIFGLMK